MSKGTDTLVRTGAPNESLRDFLNVTFSQSEDPQVQYSNSDFHQPEIKPCSVTLTDLFSIKDTSHFFQIKKCSSKRCKTCPVLSTDLHFKSNLTNKEYCTRSFEDLSCSPLMLSMVLNVTFAD